MPTNLKNRPKKLQEDRAKFIAKLKARVGKCELSGKPCNIRDLDVHEFWLPLRAYHDNEVARVALLHLAGVIVLNHDLHISNRPSLEDCLTAISDVENRPNYTWNFGGFRNYYEAVNDFKLKIQGFYETGQLKTTIPYIPKKYT